MSRPTVPRFGVRVLVGATGEPARGVNLNGHAYTALPTNTEYALELHNKGDTDCNALVDVDGLPVASLRIRANTKVSLERPTADDKARKFTFIKEDSTQGKEAGITKGRQANGVIAVTFRPEMKQPEPIWGVTLSSGRGVGLFGYQGEKRERSLTVGAFGFGMGAPPVGAFGFGGGEAKERDRDREHENFSLGMVKPAATFSSGATTLGAASSQTFATAAHLGPIDTDKIEVIVLRLVVDETDYSKLVAIEHACAAVPQAPPRVD